ncbi:MAG TPA: hypothetical protein VFC84_04875 [Desulfosporosinus sp.]|nr:hypothetical protein [Desulfosporosinus sp.]
MKKETTKNIIYIIVALMDLLLISGALILQYYSDEKMGVMRYLVSMNYEFDKGWFNPSLIKLYTITLETEFVICLFILIYSLLKKKRRAVLQVWALALIANVSGYIVLRTHLFSDLKAYYFIVIAILSIAFLQLLLSMFQLLRGD